MNLGKLAPWSHAAINGADRVAEFLRGVQSSERDEVLRQAAIRAETVMTPVARRAVDEISEVLRGVPMAERSFVLKDGTEAGS